MENQDGHCCCGCADDVEKNEDKTSTHIYTLKVTSYVGNTRPIVFIGALHYRLHFFLQEQNLHGIRVYFPWCRARTVHT